MAVVSWWNVSAAERGCCGAGAPKGRSVEGTRAVEKLGMEGAAVELVGSAFVVAEAAVDGGMGGKGAEDDMVSDTRLLRRRDLLRRK